MIQKASGTEAAIQCPCRNGRFWAPGTMFWATRTSSLHKTGSSDSLLTVCCARKWLRRNSPAACHASKQAIFTMSNFRTHIWAPGTWDPNWPPVSLGIVCTDSGISSFHPEIACGVAPSDVGWTLICIASTGDI
uniref:Uncharacterized protein n=1 Tax=Ananas comosus var. bracteatus TaxID=296719 RepID=A0A6V7PGU9_ANACO|nr:unnamed protein product [Ananas comosus var. bracteatus]